MASQSQIVRCKCGRRRAKNATRCTKCYRQEAADRQAETAKFIATANAAIRAGLILEYGSWTIPGQQGNRVAYFYDNGVAGGLWSVDNTKQHWCGLESFWTNKVEAWRTR